VRDLLARWGRLELSAPPEELERIGVRVRVAERGTADGPVGLAVTRAVASLAPDLVVVGTSARAGLDRLLHGSVGQEVARDVHPATLLVPQRARGLVHEHTGSLRLQRVVVPVTAAVPYEPVIAALHRLVAAVDPGPVTVHFVHVGAPATMPALSPPARPHWTWATELRGGAVADGIVGAADEHEADLVAMATSGHDSFLDALRGSMLERVLQRVRCPVLAVRA
jgi:nucleotide-binding universal stress UspA family protein